MANIQDPETRSAYAGAHAIADDVFATVREETRAAAQVRSLKEQLINIGFGPKDESLEPDAEIVCIARRVGELLAGHPGIATPWPEEVNQPPTVGETNHD